MSVLVGSDAGEGAGELVAQGFDVWGVGGVADGQDAGGDVAVLAVGDQCGDGVGVAGDDGGGGSVDGGDVGLSVVAGQ